MYNGNITGVRRKYDGPTRQLLATVAHTLKPKAHSLSTHMARRFAALLLPTLALDASYAKAKVSSKPLPADQSCR